MRKLPREARLIINADDFGLTRGVNEGIIDAHEMGILTSTTLMANMPAALHAVNLASNCPKLGVGVHVNLTSGRAVGPLDDLTDLTDDEGMLPNLLKLLLKASLPKTIVPIRREIKSQITRALELGLNITHLDSHKHVMVHPIVLAASISVAREFGIQAIRAPVEDKPLSKIVASSLSSGGRSRSAAINLLAKRTRRVLRREGFTVSDWFLGIARTGDWDAPALATAILSLKPGTTEIMVHPGRVDDDLRSMPTRLVESRRRELDMLISDGIWSAVDVSGVQLVNYQGIARSSGQGDRNEPAS